MVVLEKYFKALSNINRIKLFSYLQNNGESSIDHIVDELKLPYKTIFRNLSVLRTAGFIESRINKNKALFRVNTEANEIAEHLIRLITRKN